MTYCHTDFLFFFSHLCIFTACGITELAGKENLYHDSSQADLLLSEPSFSNKIAVTLLYAIKHMCLLNSNRSYHYVKYLCFFV